MDRTAHTDHTDVAHNKESPFPHTLKLGNQQDDLKNAWKVAKEFSAHLKPDSRCTLTVA